MEMAMNLPDSLSRFERALLENFRSGFQDWSQCRLDLVHWENEHLLTDDPDPEKLAQHKKALERLIFFGQILALTVSHPEFPDSELAECVQANQWSPELERLVEAFYKLQDCDPGEERKFFLAYRRLFLDAVTRLPSGKSASDLQDAIRIRARQMKQARRKPSTLPPKA